jgi:hypothetical protein
MKIERMPETKTAPERESNVVVANNLEEYVRELSQRMILPKGKIENFKDILASPDQLAPLVEKTEDTRIELKVTTPSRTRFAINSEIKAPKNKEKLKTASRSVQLASLAEAEARFRVIKRSEHIPDQVRYAGFNLDRTISKLHKQSEKLVKGEKVFGKTKAEKKMGIIALSLAAAACGKIPTPIQPAPVESVATEVTSLPTETEEPTPTETEEPTPTPEVKGPSSQELRQLLVGQGLEVEVKELEDGTEIVVKENEWGLDVVNAIWAEGINPQDNVELVMSGDGNDATLIYLEEQILAFSDKNYSSFLIQDGQITTWRGAESLQAELPEGTTEISFFDKHNEEWYAIDVYGRAVVKLNEGGEWEKYERPVRIARWENIQESFPSDITEELSPREVIRLVGDEGETIPYGYLFERSPYDDGKPTHVFVSGHSLGMFVRETPVGHHPILAFEVSVRYERQIIFIIIPDQTNSFSNLDLIPISRNINEKKRHPKSFHELGVALSKSEAVGSQMVIAFQIRNRDDTKVYNDALEELVTALKKGEGASVNAMFTPSCAWIDGNLFSP